MIAKDPPPNLPQRERNQPPSLWEGLGEGSSTWVLTISAVVAVVAIAFWLRLPLVTYNAPVSVHPDERGTLGLLWRLRTESANPHFFAYPTFYFYIASFWTRTAPMGEILPTARLLNLLLGCGIGVATGGLAWQATRSRAILLLTTALVLFSPELVFNTSYLAVDALFVLLNVLALWLWLRWWDSAESYIWIAAAIVSGLAIGTKYNAVIVLVSMMAVEFAGWGAKDGKRSGRYLPRSWQIGLPIVAALGLGAISFLDPTQLVSLMPNRATIEPEDVAFVAQWLTLFRLVAIAGFGTAAIIYWFPAQVKRFFLLRPYIAFAIAVAVFFMATPFALVSWQEFLLDVGTELKKNALSGDARYWLRYGGWLRQFESLLAIGLAPIGLIIAIRRWPRAALLLGSYLLLNYLAIGSATRGFERYLSPLLPVVYLFSAVAIITLPRLAASRFRQAQWRRVVQVGLLGLLILGIGIETTPKLQRVLNRAGTTNYHHAGYSFIVERGLPHTIHFEGFVPMFELKVHGVLANWIAVTDEGWIEAVAADDLVMVDRERDGMISAEIRQSLNLLWSSEAEHGLYIYEKVR